MTSVSNSSNADGKAPEAVIPFSETVHSLNSDPYLFVADTERRLISVFDDLRYDRSDLDALSAPMRRRALRRLEPLGLYQKSGSIIESTAEDLRIHIPKFRALGASPYDALRDLPLRPQDFVLLTPTQAAAQILLTREADHARTMLEALIARQPINLLRLYDFKGSDRDDPAFKSLLEHLTYFQRQAIGKEPLKTRRALR